MSDGSWWPESEDEELSEDQQQQQPIEDPSSPPGPRRRSPWLPLRTQKIHILGLQTPGKYLAFALAGAAKSPEVVLLTPRREPLEWWKKEGQGITLTRYGRSETRYGATLEVLKSSSSDGVMFNGHHQQSRPSEEEEEEPISQLIVNTNSGGTVPMLQSIRHRLDRQSTILFMHNSMGIMEEVSDMVFPDIDTRPNYILGLSSRTVIPSSTGGFSIGFEGLGTMQVSLVPRYFEEMRSPRFRFHAPPSSTSSRSPVEPNASSQYLLRSLSRTPEIQAIGLPYLDLLSYKLQKLAIRAIIDPLTTTFDCRNGDLLGISPAEELMERLSAELSSILLNLPEIKHLPTTPRRMNRVHLLKQTLGTLETSANESSSMLRDVRAGRTPDVKYVNGYFLKRARELVALRDGGGGAPGGGLEGERKGGRGGNGWGGAGGGLNRMMMNFVWTAHTMKRKQKGEYVPFDPILSTSR
ncbi:MAG: hypothetical protein M1823_002815 [Watsoniomyces obsoletus]|nr:MAG: hypothetical protein M1823_002815 [Watsoniomyces obsoletus]